ncbi:MAG TPA: hypothetical protein PLN52_24105 [Opitutaceae bacterium]|nr:hypothetical protein [Opitutaceae bacterium]
MSAQTDVSSLKPRARNWPWWQMIAVFLIVLGAKMIVIDRFGSDIPYWDQWNKQGDLILDPWLERGSAWETLPVPHSEHRIIPTLLLNVVLVLTNGQWDGRLESIVNAGLHALIVAVAVGALLRYFRAGVSSLLAAGLTLAVILPLGYENILSGFQSQFYIMMGLSLFCMYGMLCRPALSGLWWSGWLAGAVALVSMGSGFLAGVVVMMCAGLFFVSRWGNRRDALLTLIAGAVLAGIGAWLRAPAPWHDYLHAQSIQIFITYLLKCLAWPWVTTPWLAFLFWTPWLLFIGRWIWTRHASDDRFARLILAGGLWVAAQAAAVAYHRSADGGETPASRYGDVFLMGLFFSGAALLELVREQQSAGRRIKDGLAGAWVGVFLVGLWMGLVSVWGHLLPGWRDNMRACERNLQAYLATHDLAHLERGPIPFPVASELKRIIDKPTIGPIMPSSIRPPLPLSAASPEQKPFTEARILPLAYRKVIELAPGEHWESAVVSPSSGWWKIETTGDVGTAGATFEMVSAATGKVLAKIRPTKIPRGEWRAAYVPAPSEPAILKAQLAAPGQILGFSEPIEMAAGSYWAWQLCRQGKWFVLLGLGLWIGREVWDYRRRRAERYVSRIN